MNLSENLSADYIDAQYRKWKSDPGSLPEDWQFHAESVEKSLSEPGTLAVMGDGSVQKIAPRP